MKIRYMLAGILVLLIALTGCQQQGGNTINVEGNGEITVEPDEAEVWAGISVVKGSAEKAQNEVNKVIEDMITGLKQAGINEEDIETERLNLYEERRWEDGTSKVVGWRASQTLKVKTTDMTKVGTIVDISVNNGANQINNINFGLSKEKEQEFKQQALAQASKNAKAKAETIAQSLDVKLGKIKSVSESSFRYAPYGITLEAKASGDMIEEANAAAVMPRDVTVTAQISLVYNIG